MVAAVPLRELYPSFPGETPAAQERNAQRWAERLGPAFTSKDSGEWHVSDKARLPSGQTIEAYLHVGPEPDRLQGYRVPAGALLTWSEKDRQRFIDTHELLRRWRAVKDRFPRLPEKKQAAILQAESGEWATARGLKCGLSSLYVYKTRVNPNAGAEFDGNIDRRGRPAVGDSAERCAAPEAWELFKSLFLSENQHSLAAAWKFTRGQAAAKGWAWPSLSAVRDRVRREIPKPVQVMAREGERQFRADCLPKMDRGLEQIPAGSHWVGDERILDILCRVPDARKGWRQIRPKLTAWLDMGSRVFVGWHLGERANSETILAAQKMGNLLYGVNEESTVDRGKDYVAVGAKRSRKWDEFDPERLGNVYAQLRIRLHYAEPFTPWAKLIESNFRLVKEGFDRFWQTFCGGKPSEKPATLNARVKDVLSLPTLDEVRAAFAKFLEAHHAEPRHGLGGLSPNLVMERRESIRKCDPALLELLCCRLIGGDKGIKVGRDGVRYKSILYGQFDEQLFKLQGQRVWLRIDPARADCVIVCDRRGVPIVTASNARLSGANQEDVRKAAEHRGRLKKATRTALEGREFLLDHTPGQVMDMKRTAARRAEAEIRKALPPAPQPAQVHIARPEMTEAAGRLRMPKPAATAEDDVFSQLARVQGSTRQADQEERFDWASYRPSETERTDAPQEDVFAELAKRYSSAG